MLVMRERGRLGVILVTTWVVGKADIRVWQLSRGMATDSQFLLKSLI